MYCMLEQVDILTCCSTTRLYFGKYCAVVVNKVLSHDSSSTVVCMLVLPLLQLHSSSLESLSKRDRSVLDNVLSSVMESVLQHISRTDCFTDSAALSSRHQIMSSCESYSSTAYERIANMFDKGHDLDDWLQKINTAISLSNSVTRPSKLLTCLVSAVFVRSTSINTNQRCLNVLCQICLKDSTQVHYSLTYWDSCDSCNIQ